MDQIWDFIGDHLSNGDLITAGTPGTSDSMKDKWGIVQSHAYTVAGRVTLKNGEKLVRIRNPWGKDSYRGQYGADSPKWTSALEKEVPDAKNADDGYEYLPIAQFKVSFERLAANHNAEKMKMDYYMMLDDKSKNKPKAGVQTQISDSCGANCLLHEVTVVSSKAQKVWVQLNLWNEKTMGKDCPKDAKDKYHTIYPSPTGSRLRMQGETGGTLQVGPYSFSENGYQVFSIGIVSEGSKRPKDWSVSAWGENGDVYVYGPTGAAESASWGMSSHMAKYGAKSKPALNTANLKKIKNPN